MKDNMKVNISDELLAAFLDGNTTLEESRQVLQAAACNEELREIIQLAGEVDTDMGLRQVPASARKVLPATALAAKKKENYLCDIECEEFVLHQLGIESTHKTLLDEAYRNSWLKDRGMPLYNIGRLLEKNHLAVSRRYDASLADIVRLLAQGNQLIAVVDSEVLSPECDLQPSAQPNHAVVVHAINEEQHTVRLLNPNADERLDDYPLDRFAEAWSHSRHYLVVANTTESFAYDPSPIDLEDVTLDDDLLELQEAIAENAHEVWAYSRQQQGWSYGPERNDTLKQTPDFVPYCCLPESEKHYDRALAMQTLKLVNKLGFEIRRRK